MRAERMAAARGAVIRLAAATGLFVAALWVAVYWVEAEKELRILCGMPTPGMPAAEVSRLFGTANLTRLEALGSDGRSGSPSAATGDSASRTLRAMSARNLQRSRCTIEMRDGAVVRAQHDSQFTLSTPAAAILMIGLLGLLARDALRALLLAFAVLCVAQVAGLFNISLLAPVAEDALWLLTILCLGRSAWIVASPTAERRWRRATGAAALALCGIVLLLDPPAAVAQTSAGVKLSDTPARLEG